MNEQTKELGIGGTLLVLSGSALIIAAVIILLSIAFLVYQIFYEPDQIYLVKYLMKTIDLSDKAFFGEINNANFFIHLTDPVKYFLYLMAVVLVLSLVVSIFRGILSAGVSLIKIANRPCDKN